MKFWPFRSKASSPVGEMKSASFLYSTAVIATMQHRYEEFASEGYGLNPIVRACIEKIATALTSVELKAYVNDKSGKLVEEPNHPILKLLNQPNPMMTGKDLIGDLARYRLICGNGYVYGTGIDATKTNPQPPKELYLFRPNTIKVVEGEKYLPLAYEYTTPKSSQKFAVNPINGMCEVLHIKTFNPISHFTGLSPLAAAAYAVDVFNAGEKWNLSLLQNESRPSGAMVVKGVDGAPKTLTDEQYKRIREQVDQQFSGARNAGRPLLLEGGLEWQQMSFNAKDMDHKENMLNNARWIASVYGIPPMLINIPGDSTYSNFEQARLALWTDTVLPLLQSLLESLNAWLGKMYNDGVQLWYDEDMIPALEPLRKAKSERIEASSTLTLNEKRRAMGHDDVQAGDVILVDSSKVPLELIGDMGLSEPGSANQ